MWTNLIDNAADAMGGKGEIIVRTRRGAEGSIDRILRGARAIAVVGPSEKEGLHGRRIPEFLKEKGYRIYPIHPTLERFLGEKSYRDLASVPEKVDLALILRPAEEAAAIAREAGMDVVMDGCVRTEHLRMAGSGRESGDERNDERNG